MKVNPERGPMTFELPFASPEYYRRDYCYTHLMVGMEGASQATQTVSARRDSLVRSQQMEEVYGLEGNI